MAEQGNGADQPQQQQAVRMNILTQFIRDMSFENILAQRGTGGEVQPELSVSIQLEPKKRQPEHQYELIAKMTIGSKDKNSGDQLFLLEMEYAGVFHIEGVPNDQMHPYLMIECPRMLFPFIRRIVSDITRDGGFPPVNLENIDFVQLYRNEIARRQSAAQEQAPETPDA